jgi:hypothetical protein
MASFEHSYIKKKQKGNPCKSLEIILAGTMVI